MRLVLLTFRYLLFGVFVICNAITCSAAVWNLSLAQSNGLSMNADVFVVVVGALALTFIFPLIIIELIRSDPVTSRIWFECVWTGVFWILELAGSAAITASGLTAMCSPGMVKDSCLSTQILIAFSWTCTVMLAIYGLLLGISAFTYYENDSEIWHCSVRHLPRNTRNGLGSSPNSPTRSLPRFRSSALVAPQPRHPLPLYAHQSGMSSDYHIEHYHPSQQPVSRPMPPAPAAFPSQRSQRSTREVLTNSTPSFYPKPIQQLSTTSPPQMQSDRSVTPPPLGNWPRANAMAVPVHSKRKAPPSASSLPSSSQSSVNSSHSSHSRPTRTPGSSGDWRVRPPPLDLSKISSHRDNSRRGR